MNKRPQFMRGIIEKKNTLSLSANPIQVVAISIVCDLM